VRKKENSRAFIEGKALGNIILLLMLQKPKLAAAVKTLARDMRIFISKLDAD